MKGHRKDGDFDKVQPNYNNKNGNGLLVQKLLDQVENSDSDLDLDKNDVSVEQIQQ